MRTFARKYRVARCPLWSSPFFCKVDQRTSSTPLPSILRTVRLVGFAFLGASFVFGCLALFAGATEAERDILAGLLKLVLARYSHLINAAINGWKWGLQCKQSKTVLHACSCVAIARIPFLSSWNFLCCACYVTCRWERSVGSVGVVWMTCLVIVLLCLRDPPVFFCHSGRIPFVCVHSHVWNSRWFTSHTRQCVFL